MKQSLGIKSKSIVPFVPFEIRIGMTNTMDKKRHSFGQLADVSCLWPQIRLLRLNQFWKEVSCIPETKLSWIMVSIMNMKLDQGNPSICASITTITCFITSWSHSNTWIRANVLVYSHVSWWLLKQILHNYSALKSSTFLEIVLHASSGNNGRS